MNKKLFYYAGIEIMELTERITAYMFYVWMLVLTYLLIKKQPEQRFPED